MRPKIDISKLKMLLCEIGDRPLVVQDLLLGPTQTWNLRYEWVQQLRGALQSLIDVFMSDHVFHS